MNEACSSTLDTDPATLSGSHGQVSQEKVERAKKNKERALKLREARNRAQPYAKSLPNTKSADSGGHGAATPMIHMKTHSSAPSIRDSHAGYIIEEGPVERAPVYRVAEESVPALPDALLVCSECGKKFAESYLYTKFQLITCDKCRDPEGKHALLTKTEAKQRYLLKDCDFEERNGPPLPFLLKKNPHSSGWGEMKLYSLCQVQARSHAVWGGEEGLKAERLNKAERREKRVERKYTKDIKDLRRAVRSSLIKPSSSSHTHTFPSGQEVHNPDDDTWTKTCSDCGYQVIFEKM